MVFQTDFLSGGKVDFPGFEDWLDPDILKNVEKLREGMYADYATYSLVMNKVKRCAAYTALNIDTKKHVDGLDTKGFKYDNDVGSEYQLGNKYYTNNEWDKGHLAMRSNASWGDDEDSAQLASDDTYYYTNCTLQHEDFNRDEWKKLETWVSEDLNPLDGKVSVFTGPIYGPNPRTVEVSGKEPGIIPAGFFKVICFTSSINNKLDVRAVIIFQDSTSIDIKLDWSAFDWKTYQVSVTLIGQLTGLTFSQALKDANPIEAGKQIHINLV